MKARQKKNKKQLINLTHKRLNNSFHIQEVEDVIQIFLDEFANELRSGKTVSARNFCKFNLEKTKPRKYFDVSKKTFCNSTGNNLIKVKLSKNLKKLIIQYIDVVNTFM